MESLEGGCEGGAHDEGSKPPATAQDSIDARSWSKRLSVIEPRGNVTSHLRATSVMLHGDIRVAAYDLFLSFGGFGTSSSFGQMPHVDKELAVFGLNSAFVNASKDFNVSIPKMASLFLVEI